MNKTNVFKDIKALKDSIQHLDKSCAETIALSHDMLGKDISALDSRITSLENRIENVLSTTTTVTVSGISPALKLLMVGSFAYICYRLYKYSEELREIKVKIALNEDKDDTGDIKS